MSDNIDLFEDMMGEDHAGYAALRPVTNPTKATEVVPRGQMPNGIVISYHCPECGKPASLLYSWAELYIIANGILPQPAVGIRDAWQQDSEYATAYGFATTCRTCRAQMAPVMIGIEEARHDLARHPYYKDHPQVRAVVPLVGSFLAARAAAARR